MVGETERRGSCLCGAVRVSTKATNKGVGACHCSMCRKWTGGPLLVIGCGSDAGYPEPPVQTAECSFSPPGFSILPSSAMQNKSLACVARSLS
jgi:hypothetical protein